MLVQEKNVAQEAGVKLKKVRENLHYSTTEMASQLGVSRTTYWKNEKGSTFPGYPSLRRLSEDYGISMDWFIFDKGPMYFNEREVEDEEVNEENGPVMEMKPELMELLEHMARIPLLYHEVLSLFHKFRIANKDLVGESMGLNQEE